MKDHLDLSSPCINAGRKTRPMSALRADNKQGYRNVSQARLILLAYLHMPIDHSGGTVCHACNNELCLSPLHLYLGTQKDNIHDQINSGTWVGHKSTPQMWKVTSPEGVVTFRRGLNRVSKFTGFPKGSIGVAAASGKLYKGWSFTKVLPRL